MFLNILSLLYKLKNSKFLIQESYDCKLFSVSDNKCFKVIVDFLFSQHLDLLLSLGTASYRCLDGRQGAPPAGEARQRIQVFVNLAQPIRCCQCGTELALANQMFPM